MRRIPWIIGLALVAFTAAGCETFDNMTFKDDPFTIYRRADVEGMYAKVQVGWTQSQVVDLMGKPSKMVEHEMFYLFDDPERPARVRIVLDERLVVTAKYYETKDELAKKAAEAAAKPPVLKGEKPEAYPGAPLDRFTAPPGQPVL
jgi:outer membrane protein assembly factor BamE (lipoprotein component of BamABCDE complex)